MRLQSSLGLKVIWALSLPGKVAPVTSGIIIKDTIMNILTELGCRNWIYLVKRIGFAMCGSFCTFKKAISALESLSAANADIFPIMSEMSYNTGHASELRRLSETK